MNGNKITFKKNIYFYYGYPSSRNEKINKIKEAGFDGVFLFADEYLIENIKMLQKNNLHIETVHLPFRDLTDTLWSVDSAGDKYVEQVINLIHICGLFGIPKAVFHCIAFIKGTDVNPIGYERIKRIVKVCEQERVFLAIENINNLEMVDMCLEKIKSDYVSCCFDCGHANAFTHNINVYDFEKYRGRINCLHLHDNNGISDQHLPIFEGNIDYKKLMRELHKLNYKEPLTLELLDKVQKVTEEEFLKQAYNSLVTLEEYYNACK